MNASVRGDPRIVLQWPYSYGWTLATNGTTTAMSSLNEIFSLCINYRAITFRRYWGAQYLVDSRPQSFVLSNEISEISQRCQFPGLLQMEIQSTHNWL